MSLSVHSAKGHLSGRMVFLICMGYGCAGSPVAMSGYVSMSIEAYLILKKRSLLNLTQRDK
jgi:hypothetical protein